MPPLWCISAARIIHDQQAATITYQDAQFEFFGVPVLYLPYFQHPDPSVKHRSGFLTPSYANSSTLGFGFEMPYYFALAPNYDFTFHPQYWSKQGVLWQGDWRHRLANGQYTVKVAAIDQGRDEHGATIAGDAGWRGSLETKGQFSLSSWWRFGWDVTVDSDDSFRRFYQLDPILQTDRVNTIYLQGMSDRNYFSAKLYQFGGLLLTDTALRQLLGASRSSTTTTSSASPVLGGELSFTGMPAAMTPQRRRHGQQRTRVVEANWRRKMIDPIGQVWTPFANARGDVYNYADAVDPGVATPTPIPNDTALRGVGRRRRALLLSVRRAHGRCLARDRADGADHRAPKQGLLSCILPDEDAKSLVFDDTLLFDIDKFSGYDRFETGTRANVGLQYTFQANNGLYARAVFGQSYHLAGDNPYTNPGLRSRPGPTCTNSISPA